MPIKEAMKLTLNEIIIMQMGKGREYEKQMHSIRLIMWEIRTKHLKKGKTITPEDIFKLSTDKEKTPDRMTKEQFLELIERGKTKN
jgi:hypothetical protein